MKNIGSIEERVKCGRNSLFGLGDLKMNFIDSLFMTEVDPELAVVK